MKVEEFLKIRQSNSEEYCACLIDERGEIYDIRDGHLNALMDYYGDRDILSKLPNHIAPMFWLIVQTKVVVVDYENQIHSGAMTKEQEGVLQILSECKKIQRNLYDIHGKYNL